MTTPLEPEDFIDPDEGYRPGEQPAMRGSTEDWLVANLAGNLMDREVPLSAVADYSAADWDNALADAHMAEYAGRITDCIAARVTCQMLRAQLEGRV